METRGLIPYNYRLYNGHVMCRLHVDGYNAIQERINAFINDGRVAPVELLNASHKYLHDIIINSAEEC